MPPTDSMKVKEIDGFKFLWETFKSSGGKELGRTVCAAGRMVVKTTSVKKSAIPNPLMGAISDFVKTGMDKGHIIAQELGGPNSDYNIAPMYAYFNRRGVWKAVERKLAEKLGEESYVGIVVSYFSDKPYLPYSFKVKTGTSPIGMPFSDGEETVMKLYPAAPYGRDPEIEKRIFAALPKERDADAPYAFMDDQRKAWGLRQPLKTEKFNADEREYIRVANSLFSQHLLGQKGFLISDSKKDMHKILNFQGNEDFPEVDHVLPKSWGGSCAFANGQLVSWEYNNVNKRAQVTEEQRTQALQNSADYKEGKIGVRASKKQKTE